MSEGEPEDPAGGGRLTEDSTGIPLINDLTNISLT